MGCLLGVTRRQQPVGAHGPNGERQLGTPRPRPGKLRLRSTIERWVLISREGHGAPMARSRPGEAAPPDSIPDALVVSMLDSSNDGLLVIDQDRRCIYANAAGSRLLGDPAPTLVGRTVDRIDRAELRWSEWSFEFEGRQYSAISLHPTERDDKQQQRLAAFARTAARVALLGPVDDVLDRVAAEARATTGAAACSIILLDRGGISLQQVGSAGLERDYLERLRATVDAHAPLAMLEAVQTGRPARRDDLPSFVTSDPSLRPLAESALAYGWTSLVAVPMVVQDESLGVLTSFYDDGVCPSDADVDFLVTLADQTGVAVHNARLFNELQVAAETDQRHRWTRDLHDTVSQTLFSFILQTRAIQMALQKFSAEENESLTTGLVRLESLAETMQHEMRDLMTRLQPKDRDTLIGSIAHLASQIREQTGIPVEVEAPASEPALEPHVRTEIFRIVREAVHNAVKHAHADSLTIGVNISEGVLSAEVRDNGSGFDPEAAPAPGHVGLASMRERAARVHGDLKVHSVSGETTVQVTVDIDTEGSTS